MNALDRIASTTDLTEGDVQIVLDERDRCWEAGDLAGWANALLVLSHVVKWVPTNFDNVFSQSKDLGQKALEMYESLNDVPGIVRALLVVAAGNPKSAELLDRAEFLAVGIRDEKLIHAVKRRRAASLGFTDRAKAYQLYQESLEYFVRERSLAGQASCLFSMIVYAEDNDALKLDLAIRSADLYEVHGDRKQATKAMIMACMYVRDSGTPSEYISVAERTLRLAQATGDWGSEEGAYRHLAEGYTRSGNPELAATHSRWANEVEARDGLTPEERKAQAEEEERAILELMRSMGHDELADEIENESSGS